MLLHVDHSAVLDAAIPMKRPLKRADVAMILRNLREIVYDEAQLQSDNSSESKIQL